MTTKRLTRAAAAGLVCLLTAAFTGCGGGGEGDKPDSGTTLPDTGVIDIDADTTMVDAGELPDATIVDAAPADAQTALKRATIVIGNGSVRVMGTARSLNLLVGQPFGRSFAVPGGQKIEPGLYPQTKAP